eukprot:scaffold3812_cov115-Isochrysis_galbana.AAC.5
MLVVALVDGSILLPASSVRGNRETAQGGGSGPERAGTTGVRDGLQWWVARCSSKGAGGRDVSL